VGEWTAEVYFPPEFLPRTRRSRAAADYSWIQHSAALASAELKFKKKASLINMRNIFLLRGIKLLNVEQSIDRSNVTCEFATFLLNKNLRTNIFGRNGTNAVGTCRV
jgi:hypothetical protein